MSQFITQYFRRIPFLAPPTSHEIVLQYCVLPGYRARSKTSAKTNHWPGVQGLHDCHAGFDALSSSIWSNRAQVIFEARSPNTRPRFKFILTLPRHHSCGEQQP